MFHRTYRPMLLLAAVSLGVVGCGDGDSEKREAGRTGSPASRSTVPAHADAALLAVVDGFKQNRPEAIWEFLPESYQQDVNRLARDFAVRMDPELWDETASVARQSAAVMKTRKRQILSHPAVRDSPWVLDGSLSRKWDGFVALLETLAGSELADLKQMKSFDGGKFFAGFDAESLRHVEDLSVLLSRDNPFSMLREMIDGAAVRLVYEDEPGNAATVRIEPKSGEPREFDFVRVEGKWFPKNWASGFRDDIAQARTRLRVELARGLLAQKKQLIMPYLKDAAEVLDELEQAETDTDFHNVMTERIIKPALHIASAGSTGGGGEAVPVDLAATPGAAVKIVVARELDDATIQRIADTLLEGGGDVDRDGTEGEVTGGQTVFVVSPVKDLALFARSIKFGTVKKVDVESRTITVDVPLPKTSQPDR